MNTIFLVPEITRGKTTWLFVDEYQNEVQKSLWEYRQFRFLILAHKTMKKKLAHRGLTKWLK